ncbi:DUF6876 family protein [Prosthecobacter fusiformis]
MSSLASALYPSETNFKTRPKGIEFTDFPLDEIAFYFTDNVLMLPSEY